MVRPVHPSTIPGTAEPTAASRDADGGGAWTAATRLAARGWSDVTSDVTADVITGQRKPDAAGSGGLDPGLSALREVGVTLLSNLHHDDDRGMVGGSGGGGGGSSSSSNYDYTADHYSSNNNNNNNNTAAAAVATSYFSGGADAAAAAAVASTSSSHHHPHHHPNPHHNGSSISSRLKDADVSWLYLENITGSVGNFSNGTGLGVGVGGEDGEGLYDMKHPALGTFLALVSFVVIVGNIMVIVAVFKELYLRSVTNYFIVSLAIADVMVGGVVMPFSISHEMTNAVWLYGQEWCDLWHSLDVLASTASILNLCVISLDRYWAITDPINYPSRMSNSKVCLLITLVWVCSAGISFPAIAWWKAVTESQPSEHQCQFTEDSGYLIISSLISFYFPTFIMMFVYAKIYRAAMAQSEGIKAGSKIASNGLRGDDGEMMTLRIHRGGARNHHHHHHSHHQLEESNHHSHHSSHSHHHHNHHHHHSNGGGGGGGGGSSSQIQYERSTSDSDGESPCHSTRVHVAEGSNSGTPRPAKHITKRLRHFAISKKLTKLAREQKAAKTLGIVVGVFIICWLPFFVTNMLFGVCKLDCIANPEILYPVVTWLGYINSGMNPIIYALSMRDFRRAFSKMVFCCCPRYRYQQHQRTYQHHNSMSTSSFSAACSDKCAALKI